LQVEKLEGLVDVWRIPGAMSQFPIAQKDRCLLPVSLAKVDVIKGRVVLDVVSQEDQDILKYYWLLGIAIKSLA